MRDGREQTVRIATGKEGGQGTQFGTDHMDPWDSHV